MSPTCPEHDPLSRQPKVHLWVTTCNGYMPVYIYISSA